jgi:hypothetical protein
MPTKDVDNGDNKLPIQEFNLSSMMVENPSIVMVAKRGSGKSWVVRAILQHFRDIPVGTIISPTDRMNCFYGNFFPNTYIHYTFKTEIIEKLLYRQTKIIDKNDEYRKKGKRVDTRSFMVMDDCLASKKGWMTDPMISELLFNGRHYHIMYILTMQFPLGITPDLRNNFDYIFLLADDTTSNMKRLYDHYAGVFPDFNSFKQVFGQITQNFGSLVISNRGARSSFLDKVFYYKAPDTGDDIKMGCRQLRKFHEKNYDSEWKKKTKQFEINDFCLKKKKDKSLIQVDMLKNDDSQNK